MTVNFKIYFGCLLIVFLSGTYIMAQDMNSELKTEITNARNSKYAFINTHKLLKYNHSALSDSAMRYANDSNTNVRFNVMVLQNSIAINNKADSALQRKTVRRLIYYLNDSSKLIQQSASKFLLDFSVVAFNKTSKDTLLGIIKSKSENLNRELILIIGVAELTQMQKILLKQVNYNPVTGIRDFSSVNWCINLVLARLGNTESVQYCLRSIDNYPDTITRFSLLLSEIAFTKSKEGVVVLKKYLNSKGRLPSLKKGPGVAFSQYSCDVLAGMLVGFPIKQKGLGYTDEEIETAREWINSQKNFVIKK